MTLEELKDAASAARRIRNLDEALASVQDQRAQLAGQRDAIQDRIARWDERRDAAGVVLVDLITEMEQASGSQYADAAKAKAQQVLRILGLLEEPPP